MKGKEDFLGFSELEEIHRKDLKFLLDQKVRLREVNYKGTAGWEHYFLAEYRGVGIEFDFSDGADRRDKTRRAKRVWDFIKDHIDSSKVTEWQ